MRATALRTWGLPTAAVAGVVGIALFGYAFREPGGDLPVVISGGILILFALVLLTVAAIQRTRHDAVDHRLLRYGCDRCGYSPEADDIENGRTHPCPRCGQFVRGRGGGEAAGGAS
jgi:predicted RNA-binding Zn-ribbon protein involved in translation (DUF1610 family)